MNDIWLAHHGIKGQKWGVRRFENPDGTLTEAGKERYRDQSSENGETKKGLSKETKKKIAIGAGIAGAALLAVGAAYVAAKMNIKAKDILIEKYSQEGRNYAKTARDFWSLHQFYDSEAIRTKSDINLFGNASYRFNKGKSDEMLRYYNENSSLATRAYGKAHRANFSLKEKIQALKSKNSK